MTESERLSVPRALLVAVLRRMMQDTLQIDSEWGLGGPIDWADEGEIPELAQALGLRPGEWPDD